ncbi:hypothetical protein GLYMA_13G096950v4 [Glycine max]|nr:hypothetical protein GLYMA_13G096950v4 [Glycine max]KAH1100637.1 hypothetical protein GYH30_035673 [Glycine max]
MLLWCLLLRGCPRIIFHSVSTALFSLLHNLKYRSSYIVVTTKASK